MDGQPVADDRRGQTERTKLDLEIEAALRFFTVGILDEVTLTKGNAGNFRRNLPTAPLTQGKGAGTLRSPNSTANDAGEAKPDSSNTETGNIDHLPLILPEPSRDLGFEEATLRDEAPYATFSMLPTFDRASLETRRIAVAAAMQNDVYPQPRPKPTPAASGSHRVYRRTVEYYWDCCACNLGYNLFATTPACQNVACAHKHCSRCTIRVVK
jgi:hypothetical protein